MYIFYRRKLSIPRQVHKSSSLFLYGNSVKLGNIWDFRCWLAGCNDDPRWVKKQQASITEWNGVSSVLMGDERGSPRYWCAYAVATFRGLEAKSLPPPSPIRPHPHASQAVASKTHQSLGRNLTGHLSTPGCTRGILTSSFIRLNLFNQCARGGRTDFWISSRRKKKFTKIYNQCWSVWLLVWNLPFLCHLLQGHDTQVGQYLFLFQLNWTFFRLSRLKLAFIILCLRQSTWIISRK